MAGATRIGVAAMAPLGGDFADDLSIVPAMANKSTQVTNFHSEGIAWAIAVAVAKAVGSREEGNAASAAANLIWEAVLGSIEVGGDCDTIPTIVGGIVSAFSGGHDIPVEWLTAWEVLAGARHA